MILMRHITNNYNDAIKNDNKHNVKMIKINRNLENFYVNNEYGNETKLIKG